MDSGTCVPRSSFSQPGAARAFSSENRRVLSTVEGGTLPYVAAAASGRTQTGLVGYTRVS